MTDHNDEQATDMRNQLGEVLGYTGRGDGLPALPELVQEAAAKLNPETFENRHRAALLEAARQERARRNAIEAAVIGSRRTHRLTDLIAILADEDESISAGVYVVKVTSRVEDSAWTTVVRGKTDWAHFGGAHGREKAVLHAIALMHENDRAVSAGYFAARVLSIPLD